MDSKPPRIYLDNAATSWPKPEAVYAAVDDYQRNAGAPAGRGTYAEAVEVNRAVDAARTACARVLGAPRSAQVIFAANGTDALNMALHGLLKAGDHVVTSELEHNSVFRPLTHLTERFALEVTHVGCGTRGVIDPDDVRRALRPQTRLVILTHASNVTGALQPIGEVASLLRNTPTRLLVDAAQTAGYLPLDVEKLGIDLLATSGHKGLLGPLGTGLLYIRSGIETELQPLRQGGTGTRSEDARHPQSMPERFESGNLNVPGILGLGAGVRSVLDQTVAAIRRRQVELTDRLLKALGEMPHVRLYGPPTAVERVGLVSLTLEGYDPQEAATLLDASFRIQVRSGLHCAPGAHRALGTLERGGTVRLSLGHFTTAAQIDAVIAALAELKTG